MLISKCNEANKKVNDDLKKRKRDGGRVVSVYKGGYGKRLQ